MTKPAASLDRAKRLAIYAWRFVWLLPLVMACTLALIFAAIGWGGKSAASIAGGFFDAID